MGIENTGEVFHAYRPLLLSIAYRMLGSAMDAEDIVQEAFLHWQRHDPATVASPKAYLTAVVTHLAIDYLRSARVRREEYIGQWLPEPLVTDEHEMASPPSSVRWTGIRSGCTHSRSSARASRRSALSSTQTSCTT